MGLHTCKIIEHAFAELDCIVSPSDCVVRLEVFDGVVAEIIGEHKCVGAAVTNRRVFEPVETRILASFGVLLVGLAVLFKFFPAALMYPVILLLGWMGLALIYKACKLRLNRGTLAAKLKSTQSSITRPTSSSHDP